MGKITLRSMCRVLLCSLFLMAFGACGARGRQTGAEPERLPITESFFSYEIERKEFIPATVAVDERGYVYTVTDLSSGITAINTVSVYDTEGICVEKHELTTNGAILALCLSENRLYCVSYAAESGAALGIPSPALFAVDLETWEIECLCKVTEFSSIEKLAVVGDTLYCLGVAAQIPQKTYEQYSLSEPFLYRGLVLEAVSLSENGTKEILPIDFPVGMSETPQGTLLLYLYREDIGYYFAEYLPETRELYELRHVYLPSNFAVYNEENDLIYYSSAGDSLVLFDMSTGETSALRTGTGVYDKGALHCRKDFLFYYNSISGQIERFCVSAARKENTAIQVIANRHATNLPFGCGYQMQVTALAQDAFALKVLALDKDFDLCLLDSRSSIAYNLKENGVFYPLNEVPGVEEYLDACFPYIKEAAMTESGEIWMLPVTVDIPGFLYNEAAREAAGLPDLAQEEYLDFLAEYDRLQQEAPGKTDLLLEGMVEDFFAQYLSVEESFDTKLFRTAAERLKVSFSEHGTSAPNAEVLNSFLLDPQREVFFVGVRYADSWRNYIRWFQYADTVKACGTPKLEKNKKNTATCVFVAVNPRSRQRKETLDYLAAYVAYKNGEQNSFLFSDRSLYSDTPFAGSLYEMYANGEITFKMDDSVYENCFYEYLDGGLSLEEMVATIERNRAIYLGE